MDRLTAWVTLAHGKLRLEQIGRHRLLERNDGMSKFKGLAQKLAQFHHDLEAQASSIFDDVDSAAAEVPALMVAAKQKMAETKSAMADIKEFVHDMGATNGGPTLSGSDESPVKVVAESIVPLGPNGGPRIVNQGN